MLSDFMAVCLGRDWSTPHCSGKHPRHHKYLPLQEISHEIVEEKKINLYDQQCSLLQSLPSPPQKKKKNK